MADNKINEEIKSKVNETILNDLRERAKEEGVEVDFSSATSAKEAIALLTKATMLKRMNDMTKEEGQMETQKPSLNKEDDRILDEHLSKDAEKQKDPLAEQRDAHTVEMNAPEATKVEGVSVSAEEIRKAEETKRAMEAQAEETKRAMEAQAEAAKKTMQEEQDRILDEFLAKDAEKKKDPLAAQRDAHTVEMNAPEATKAEGESLSTDELQKSAQDMKAKEAKEAAQKKNPKEEEDRLLDEALKKEAQKKKDPLAEQREAHTVNYEPPAQEKEDDGKTIDFMKAKADYDKKKQAEEEDNGKTGSFNMIEKEPEVKTKPAAKPMNRMPARSDDMFDQAAITMLKNRYQQVESEEDKPPRVSPFTPIKQLEESPSDYKYPYVKADLASGARLYNRPDQIDMHYSTYINPDGSRDSQVSFEDCMTMVRMGMEKGWTGATLDGPKEYQEQMYLAMRAMGMKVIGYTASKELQEKGDALFKEHAPTREHAQSLDERFPALEEKRMAENRPLAEINKEFIDSAKAEGIGYETSEKLNTNEKLMSNGTKVITKTDENDVKKYTTIEGKDGKVIESVAHSYDEKGNAASDQVYDGDGKLKKTLKYPENGDGSMPVIEEYNKDGNLVSRKEFVFDENGDKTADFVVKDAAGKVITQSQPKKDPTAKEAEAKDDKKPVAKEAEAKDDKKPVAKETEAKDDKKPVAKEAESKDDKKPVAKEAEAKDDKKPVAKEAEAKDDKKPVAKETKAKDDKKPVAKEAEAKDDKKPVAKEAEAKDDKKPVVKEAEAKPKGTERKAKANKLVDGAIKGLEAKNPEEAKRTKKEIAAAKSPSAVLQAAGEAKNTTKGHTVKEAQKNKRAKDAAIAKEVADRKKTK